MRLRHNERAIGLDEQHVCSAGFLNVGARLGIKIQVLGIALAMCFHDGAQRHGVVQASLDVTGAVRGSAVIFGNANRDGLQAALKVRPDGSYQNAELVFRCGSNADNLARANHERANIQRGARAKRRDPRSVRLHNLLHGFNETLLREAGHLETLGGVVHALSVHIGAETYDGAIFGGVCLEALEDLLAIMKNASALGKVDFMIGGKAAFVPFAVFPIGDIAIVGFAVAEIEAAPVKVFLLDCHGCSFNTYVQYAPTLHPRTVAC